MSSYCPKCGNPMCMCQEIKRAESPHMYKKPEPPPAAKYKPMTDAELDFLLLTCSVKSISKERFFKIAKHVETYLQNKKTQST